MRKTIAVIFIVLSIFALVACNDEPAHEHTWNEGEITTKATCTTDGVMTYTCTSCGETKTEAIAATGHSIQAVAAKAATCTEAGCIAHYKCDTCSKLFSDAQGATEVTAESVVIAKLNHTLSFVEGVEKTCETDGLVAHYHCSVCEKNFSDEAGIEEITGSLVIAAGHTFSDTWSYSPVQHWREATCGHTAETGRAMHTYDSGVYTSEPSCGHAGEIKYSCTVCGRYYTQNVPALEHVEGPNHTCTLCGNFVPFEGPTGGYIFYDCDFDNNEENDGAGPDGLKSDVCGWRYLEAAPADLRIVDGVPTVDSEASGYAEAETRYIFGYYKKEAGGTDLFVNGTAGYNVANCTGTGIGMGKSNTELLVGAMGSAAYAHYSNSTITSEYAARLCYILEYTVNGVTYDDWFIPSVDEMAKIFENSSSMGLSTGNYWTSSENPGTAGNFRYFNFSTGSGSYCSRMDKMQIRPVRAIHEHSFDEVKETIAATCTASGTGTQTCTVCGYVKDVTIPALGHDMVDHVCTRCGLFEPFIGEAGGYVFYDCDADNAFGNADGLVSCDCGWRYLEAAPEDLEVASNYYHSFGYYRESDAASNKKVGTSNNLGTGKANTEALVDAMGSEVYKKSSGSDKISDYAAKLCADYSIAGKDDWFLPSKDELNLMYTNLKLADLGGFSDDSYLSSSEYNEYSTWGQFFLNGNQSDYSRHNTPRIRPVRAYGAPEGEHVHTFSSAWTYSPSQHWHAATCGHTGEKADVATHTYDEGVVATPATCQEDGAIIYTCTVCGSQYQSVINHLEHNLETVSEVPATCTLDGKKAYYHCSRCGKNYDDGGKLIVISETLIIPATGHKWDGGSSDGQGNIVYECQTCHETKTQPMEVYDIGDIGPAGGYILYDCDTDNDETNEGAGPDGLKSDVCGWRYLEAAPSDLRIVEGVPTVDSSAIGYSEADVGCIFGYYRTTDNGKNLFVNGTASYDSSNCTGTAIGTGKSNTQLLVDVMETEAYSSESGSEKSSDYAARLCDILVYTYNEVAYDDWFLPSKDEAKLMYTNLKQNSIGGFTGGYLASSEYNSNGIYAWLLGFSSGNWVSAFRAEKYRIRPVRSFL